VRIRRRPEGRNGVVAVAWLGRLETKLYMRQPEMRRLDDYYSGNHPLPFVTPAHQDKLRNEFRQLLEESRTNFMRLVVDVVEERMRVEGFRESARSDITTDQRAWEIWQENQMDSQSQVAILEALVKSVSYLSVWKTPNVDMPTIAVEDATQTIVGYETGSNFTRRAAALKIWQDDVLGERANVYLPDGIYKFHRGAADGATPATTTADEATFGETTKGGARRRSSGTPVVGWVEIPGSFVRNPIGEVPIVALRNRLRLLLEGESEISDVTSVQNQINGFLFLLALAGYFGAHRQRWAVGAKLFSDEGARDGLDQIDTAIDKLWATENEGAKFGDFEATDLAGYIKAIEQKVLHIAVMTRTPRHYLVEQGQSPSGDAIKSAESGLVKKVRRKMRPFGEGFEEAMRLARSFQGLATPADSEIVWADPEIRTEAEITDAAIKRFQAGLTDRHQALEDMGYTQTQIARMLAQSSPVPSPVPAPEADPEPVLA